MNWSLMIMMMMMVIGLPCYGQSDLTARLKTQMGYLTSPEAGGRDAPGPNGDKVAQWVADRFREDGLLPAIIPMNYPIRQSSYFDSVQVISAQLDPEFTKLWLYEKCENFVVTAEKYPDETEMRMMDRDYETYLVGVDQKFVFGKDLYTFPRRINYFDRVEEKWVDCGYGLSLPEAGRNDYPADVLGKIAVVRPGSDLPADKVGMRSGAAFKAAAAERAGATALIVCYPDTALWPPKELAGKIADLEKPLIDIPYSSSEFPIFYVRLAPGKNIATTFSDLFIRMKLGYQNRFEKSAINVVGMIPGSTDEWVIVGAHYDHLGEGFPGADDNASGTVGLLELARKWGRSGEVPKRGIIFVSFTCEEDGLLGSQWFAQHLPFPLEKVVAMINLDMIGRDGFGSFRESMKPGATPTKGYAAAYFSAPSPALKDILRAASDGVDLQTTVQPINSFRHFGDGAPFHEAGIPTVHIFSGFHADYHQQSDTPDKIDYVKLAKMIQLTDRSLRGLVEMGTRPGFDPTIKVESGGMGY